MVRLVFKVDLVFLEFQGKRYTDLISDTNLVCFISLFYKFGSDGRENIISLTVQGSVTCGPVAGLPKTPAVRFCK